MNDDVCVTISGLVVKSNIINNEQVDGLAKKADIVANITDNILRSHW